MTQPPVPQAPPEEPPSQVPPEQEQLTDEGPPRDVRSQLLAGVANAQTQPDLAQTVYQSLGIDHPEARASGYQSSVSDLQPGDIVGWHGGQEQDGRYIGNLAMYVGNREILESYYGTTRRRKIGSDENVFGIPVELPGDSPTVVPPRVYGQAD